MADRIDPRWVRFAKLYQCYANATRAAIEAGYAKKSASGAGWALLRNPKVQKLIEAEKINRQVHAEQTYREYIDLKDHALKVLKQTLEDSEATTQEKCLVIETVGRSLDRIARCDGLLLPVAAGDEKKSSALQIIQILHQTFNLDGKTREETKALPSSSDSPPPQDGNGKDR